MNFENFEIESAKIAFGITEPIVITDDVKCVEGEPLDLSDVDGLPF
jgi:hypothetical protein